MNTNKTTKNSGCINCTSCQQRNLDGAACYQCGNKKAWKKVLNAVFGKVLLNMCTDLNENLSCPYFSKNKDSPGTKTEVTGGTGKTKFIKTN